MFLISLLRITRINTVDPRAHLCFTRNHQTFVQSGCITAHAHENLKVRASPHPHQPLLFIVVNLALPSECASGVLTCMFLMLNDAKHFFHEFIIHLYSFLGEVQMDNT